MPKLAVVQYKIRPSVHLKCYKKTHGQFPGVVGWDVPGNAVLCGVPPSVRPNHAGAVTDYPGFGVPAFDSLRFHLSDAPRFYGHPLIAFRSAFTQASSLHLRLR